MCVRACVHVCMFVCVCMCVFRFCSACLQYESMSRCGRLRTRLKIMSSLSLSPQLKNRVRLLEGDLEAAEDKNDEYSAYVK